MADPVPLAVEFVRQLTHALAGPSQGRLRIATTDRFDQLLQIVEQSRIFGYRPLAPAAGLANARDTGGGWLGQFLEADRNGTPRYTRRTGHGRDAAIANSFGFGRRMKPAQPLVQKRFEAGKTLFDEVCVHAGQCTTKAPSSQPDMVIS